MKHVLFILQMLLLFAIVIQLWQLFRFFKKLPEDEVIGEERAKYLQLRLTLLIVCIGIESVLSIIQSVLRFFDGL
jgi:hypothetical protein